MTANALEELWEGGNALKSNCGGGCTTLHVLKTLTCTLKAGTFYGMYIIPHYGYFLKEAKIWVTPLNSTYFVMSLGPKMELAFPVHADIL